MTVRSASPRAWERLGRLLEERREELDASYYSRAAFAESRDINLKLAQDIETNARQNYTPVTLRDIVARAYGVTYASIRDVLDERPGSDLEAAPRTPPRRRAPAAAAAVPPPAEPFAAVLPEPSELMERDLEDIRAEVYRAYDKARAAHPGEALAGPMVFPRWPAAADYWDRLAARGWDPGQIPAGVSAALAMDIQEARGARQGNAGGLILPGVT